MQWCKAKIHSALLASIGRNAGKLVTILVEVYGVPYVNEYIRKEVGEEEAQKYGKIEVISTTGHWKSTYKGDGLWQVQGMIETKKWGDCFTTWTLDESDGRIRLIEFTCD